ncbi:hypothetical protein JZ751_016143, partial [Albula glossodonta]
MDDKHRALPPWMLGGGDVKQSELSKSLQSRKTTKKTRVERCVSVYRQTLYFMNEAELVEAAIRLLSEGNGSGTRALQAETGKEMGKYVVGKRMREADRSHTEEESPDYELRDRTYVSETDPEDMAEKETLPYAPDAAQEPTARDQTTPSETADPNHARTAQGASDDEAVRLVREIFFTRTARQSAPAAPGQHGSNSSHLHHRAHAQVKCCCQIRWPEEASRGNAEHGEAEEHGGTAKGLSHDSEAQGRDILETNAKQERQAGEECEWQGGVNTQHHRGTDPLTPRPHAARGEAVRTLKPATLHHQGPDQLPTDRQLQDQQTHTAPVPLLVTL